MSDETRVKPDYRSCKFGKPNKVERDIAQWMRRRLGRRDMGFFYIGQSCQPDVRLKAHQREMTEGGVALYQSMNVLYESPHVHDAIQIESLLIDLARGHDKYRAQGLNTARGRYDEKATYVVYALIDRTARAAQAPGANITPTRSMKPISDGSGEQIGMRSLLEKLQRKLETAIADRPGADPLRGFYIGYTANPASRFKQHQDNAEIDYGGDVWDDMKILFETPSLDRALIVESKLIDFARAHPSGGCLNSKGGRRLDDDGRLPKTYVYYLEEKNTGTYDFGV